MIKLLGHDISSLPNERSYKMLNNTATNLFLVKALDELNYISSYSIREQTFFEKERIRINVKR